MSARPVYESATAECIAWLERAAGEMTGAARQKRLDPRCCLAVTYTAIAIGRLRSAGRLAPDSCRMRIARSAASLRGTMRRLGVAPHDAVLTFTAQIAVEIADSLRDDAAPTERRAAA